MTSVRTCANFLCALQVPLTLISEIFNIRYRTISMTICLMWQWLCTFSIVRIMPIALDTITTKTYFLFGGIFLVRLDVRNSVVRD